MNLPEKDLVYLIDIKESLEIIAGYTKDFTESEFLNNLMLVDASVRRLEIIGEAANNISEELKSLYSELPWKEMIGMRNKLIHEYFGVDTILLWETIIKDLPLLYVQVLAILENYHAT